MNIYREMDQATLDAAYNNTAAVADSARILAEWDRRSAQMAAKYPAYLDLRYGSRERNRLDFFPASRTTAPVLVFIHGGYWQMRAKESFRFLAAGPLAHGICVVNVAYTLAPEASLQQIVDETQSAITWVAANASRYGVDDEKIYVAGWSAGGHLTARAQTHRAVRGGVAISGIFDLEPIRLSFLNDKLRLSESDVQRLSPQLNVAAASKPLVIAFGSGELPELQRQSQEFLAARTACGLPTQGAVLDDHNHFSILEELAAPGGKLTGLVVELISR